MGVHRRLEIRIEQVMVMVIVIAPGIQAGREMEVDRCGGVGCGNGIRDDDTTLCSARRVVAEDERDVFKGTGRG